jgi:molybdopterin-guanine dinucleotide biosynthesis protein A
VNVSAAILAGGGATRFGGRDKSALLVDGRTIFDRQLQVLTAVTDDVMVVGAGHAASAQQLQRAPDVRAIRDIVPGCGPLGGLHAALAAGRGDAVLVIACDMPFVTADFAGYLLSLSAGAAVVVPRTERGYHPLCAVYTRACLEPVTTRLASRRLRMRDLIDDLPARVLTVEEIERFGDRHRLLANVNTPAEFAGLEALQSH